MELMLIRHGDATPGTGGPDYPLSDLGREQARLLAERLAASPPDRLYSSTVLRARQTAEIVSARLAMAAVFDRDLREIDTGKLATMPREERKKVYPHLYRKDGTFILDFASVGGEDGPGFGKRVARAMHDVLLSRHAHTEERVAVIAHGGVINAALAHFLDAPFGGHMRFAVENTSVTTVRVRPPDHLIRSVNDHAHLAPWAGSQPKTPSYTLGN